MKRYMLWYIAWMTCASLLAMPTPCGQLQGKAESVYLYLPSGNSLSEAILCVRHVRLLEVGHLLGRELEVERGNGVVDVPGLARADINL
jgi:hypothetical protein